jgi:D-serine deaminase-like pyridoxal phosphate-dependent protein
MQLGDIETPALLLDRERLTANAQRMQTQADALGVKLRPHVKTLKSIEAAKIYAPDNSRITVSTLREAEVFAGAGYTDIFYAVGITPNKLTRAADLVKAGADLTLLLDTAEAAQVVSDASQKLGVQLSAMIEIDTDGHRAGVKADDAALVEIATALTQHGRLRGVAAHAGGSYGCTSTDEIIAHAEQERACTVKAAEKLRAAGFEVPEVSVGSTPTALMAKDLTGVTELRAGVYASFDLVMAGLGMCEVEDIATSVLCSVIGHQHEKGWILVDAGWMAMSRDMGTSAQAVDQRYGLVCSADGKVLVDYVLHSVNQEHGIIARRDGGPADTKSFPYGTQLRILPVHACATGAQHEAYHVVGADGKIDATWPRINAW